MGRIKCELVCHGPGGHVQQLLTGFVILQNRGIVDLRISFEPLTAYDETRPQHLRDARLAHLHATVNGRCRLYYDLHDSWEVDEQQLKTVDRYYKRSFSCRRLREVLADQLFERVKSLGLNYAVVPDKEDAEVARSSLRSSHPHLDSRQLDKAVGWCDLDRIAPPMGRMQCAPDGDASSRVLFLSRVWDPYDHSERSCEKSAEREEINSLRANCIQGLREAFGDRFLGGFADSPYARRHFPSLVIGDVELTKKENYVGLLASYPICVATNGVHGSIGWKFAEYLAFSRCIVSQRLEYEPPGPLAAGRNYLEFCNSRECVDRVQELMRDRELAWSMMNANREYYDSYVRPDAIILRSLEGVS